MFLSVINILHRQLQKASQMNIIPRHRIEIEFSSLLNALLFNRKKHLDGFKTKIENVFGRKTILLQSARGAFYYLLKAMPQKTIILPAYTCKAIPEAGLLAGKEIVYVDIDLHTFNMDVNDLERKIRPGSIIVATHQFGIPCEIDKMARQAKQNGCVIIEDCAGAFGTKIGGNLLGTFGLAAIFSFEVTKVLSAGWGGFILFNDDKLYERVRLIVEGEVEKPSLAFVTKILFNLFFHKFITMSSFIYRVFIAYFYRKYGLTREGGEIIPHKNGLYAYTLSPVEATLGLRNLGRVENIIQKRWDIADRYLKGLLEMKGLGLPVLPRDSFCSLMRFPVRVTNQNKKEFYLKCLGKGLDLGFSFNYSCSERCVNAVLAAQQVVNLPLNSHLRPEEVDRVINVVKEIVGVE